MHNFGAYFIYGMLNGPSHLQKHRGEIKDDEPSARSYESVDMHANSFDMYWLLELEVNK